MSHERENLSGEVCKEGLGSLSGCLVDGDAEQLARERGIRLRALAISIGLQSAVLTALILVPVFSKAERISLKIITPVPPYQRYHDVSHNSPPRPPRGPQTQCRFCPPASIPNTIVTQDPTPPRNSMDDNSPPGIGDNIPGAIDGLIPLSDPRQRVLPPPNTERQVARPQVVRMTHLDPAMLIHRVEPVYPRLAQQTRRDGRVELRAIIGTDGTIQSLQIVVSDPFFDQSALEAVGQWRYKPTILNGQPVEIDTYITVIYTTQH
jgi:periplasmic protein TonB